MTQPIKIYFWHGTLNAGDIFTAFLLYAMGLKYEFSETPDIGITGSILSDQRFDTSYIWGLGFGNPNESCKRNKVLAVRGKLTQQLLGVDCAIGDPGILASHFFNPDSSKKYKFGIIPHYVDIDWMKTNCTGKVIDIRTSNFGKLFTEINECEFILSSSLHGLIFALSYGIPAIHIKHSELASKNSFKFNDFYSTLSIPHTEIDIQSADDWRSLNLDDLYTHKGDYAVGPDEIVKLQKSLLDCFPYSWNLKR